MKPSMLSRIAGIIEDSTQCSRCGRYDLYMGKQGSEETAVFYQLAARYSFEVVQDSRCPMSNVANL